MMNAIRNNNGCRVSSSRNQPCYRWLVVVCILFSLSTVYKTVFQSVDLLVGNNSNTIEQWLDHPTTFTRTATLDIHDYHSRNKTTTKPTSATLLAAKNGSSHTSARQTLQQQRDDTLSSFPPPIQASFKRFLQRRPNDKTQESFAACIIIKDENHRLSEWLAYHYFAMPLRHVVVMMDPDSTQSPKLILEKWRPLGMNYTIWQDADIGFVHNPKNPSKSYESRQLFFIQQCFAYLRELNKTWTSVIDVDEYLVMNHKLQFMKSNEAYYQQSKNPGFVLDLIRQDPIQWTRRTRGLIRNKNASCVVIPRKAFGAKESSDQERTSGVPYFINATQLETLRFRHRAKSTAQRVNGQPKSLFNVQHMPTRDNNKGLLDKQSWGGAHYVVKPSCTDNARWVHPLLVANHYRGSLESYLSRVDGRRSVEYFHRYQAVANEEIDDDIRPWIQTLVDYVDDEALVKHLLQDAGRLQW